MMGLSVVGLRARSWLAVLGVLAVSAVFSSSAGAVLVHVGHGQVAGVTLRHGVSSTSIPGSFAGRHHRPLLLGALGQLDYHGGAVLHGVSPYLIFWDPANKIPAADKALYERFMADSAADSASQHRCPVAVSCFASVGTNVYSVDRQFTDTRGFANYAQKYSSAQSITDTQPYPAKASQCTESSFPETACLFDSQLQTELARLIAANGLPTGVANYAPLYFIVTPPDVNTCFADGTTCADNFFCAYHSSFTNGPNTVLYSSIAEVLDKNSPKGCQADGNSAVQAPNGNPIVDVSLKAVSHEYNETITDPVNGGGWYATVSGQENGDECNFAGPFNPPQDSNPNAFLPTLGGSASAGTLFNQVMNTNPYYVQSEWSNGDLNCKMRPTTSALTAAFTAPSSATVNTPVTFDPSASSSAGGYTSTSWVFGDGGRFFSRTGPVVSTHTYTTPGTYQVGLAVVDKYGNLSFAYHKITITP